MIAAGLPMTVAELAGYADVPVRLATKALAGMVELGVVVIDGDVITAPKFNQRQFESDNITARTQKHRERSNVVPTEDVGTFQPGSMERSGNGRRNTQPSRERPPAPPTETETETETETSPTDSARTITALAVIETPTAQTIIGEWIDHAPKRPPQQVIGQTSKSIAAMLAEGIDPDDVRRGVAAWMTKGLHPSTLPSVVNEVMNSTPRRSTTDQRVTAGLELAAQLRAAERKAIG